MLQQGEAGEEGITRQPTSFILKRRFLWGLVTQPWDFMHSRERMEIYIHWATISSNKTGNKIQLLCLKQLVICYGNSYIALSYFSMSIITKENLTTKISVYRTLLNIQLLHYTPLSPAERWRTYRNYGYEPVSVHNYLRNCWPLFL